MNPTTMTLEQIIKQLKEKARNYIESGETYRDNIYYNMRDHGNNDYMDEFFELAHENSDERERLLEEAVDQVMDYVDELFEIGKTA